MFSLNDFHYELPADLIAQQPVRQRDHARLLVLNRKNGRLSHAIFSAIGNYLKAGSVLVVNNSAVIPGRLVGNKETGGKVEVLISDFVGGRIANEENGCFISQCLVKTSKRPLPGTRFHFAEGLQAEVLEIRNGTCILKFYGYSDFESLLYKIGQVPLPPYIIRNYEGRFDCDDKTAYQTVYASQKGAIAAPTAGLHFTEHLLSKLRSDGVKVVEITLHVGYGTFLPVRVADIRQHQMHAEKFTISAEAAEAINCALSDGNRVIAVGTTCVRTLEYATQSAGKVQAGSGSCDLFIYPGYKFKTVDAMVTNFHLPKSTLLMLVSAFAGRQNMLNAYREAIRRRYRFYSYGDAMFIS